MNIDLPPNARVALIAGPTASGKSAAAVAVAERHRGTVINADASQVYADLRVLTARPPAEDEERVPHRLFGHVDGADGGYSAARWAAEAREAIVATLADGRLPVLVGGTGLYLRTLLDGIAPVPTIDPDIRAAVRALPVAAAHAALAAEDAAAAARLNPADTTRVARALEVIRSTGRPLSAWQAQRAGGIGDRIRLAAVRLLPPRAALLEAIDRRAAAMMEPALAEVAALLARTDIPADAPIRRAIGVPPLAAHLAGSLRRNEALQRLQLDTRQYAKRQFTWFRNQPPSIWRIAQQNIDVDGCIDFLLSETGLTGPPLPSSAPLDLPDSDGATP
ncbi:tRNA (adenosine(37)-N6)-dimethylallyltransferase MiaA [Sphingomonas sp. KR1UV-12]|uniref:tRNA dimethylallyltransferase n=1 Tax=Sphingomonas aurea TaxID=3063994 RepID=A0ABT9EG43_9SPHN|nr:tRNA (adenosine(37)-N6)-dimethylallyltransferase MiaA [Sphingomonas sp. KR1UV-12]MDP1025938.1 tRNA (adenosine(37)-N6)-dimethylallyltransferase MiaA [Sphingomonas sp. KR1UV-12]